MSIGTFNKFVENNDYIVYASNRNIILTLNNTSIYNYTLYCEKNSLNKDDIIMINDNISTPKKKQLKDEWQNPVSSKNPKTRLGGKSYFLHFCFQQMEVVRLARLSLH